MKKKKQKSGAATASTATTATATTTELKALIHDHRLFFDKLIDLIPPRFYLPIDDSDKPWYHGLSKAAKASLKQQTKANIKDARRKRLDPEKKDQSSTLDLLKQSLENQKLTENPTIDNGEEEDVGVAPMNLEESNDDVKYDDNRSVTYEELRQRLHKKIEMLRGNRGSSEKSENKKDNERKKVAKPEGKKRKRGDEGDENDEKNGTGENENEIEKGIEFGKVKIGDDEKKKKRKVSKEKELERLKRLEEVKRENPLLAERESWKAAANRAMGVKVHDDPKLLKERMKKEKRRKAKSSEKWKERVESREKSKDERQQKRRDNIAEKIREKKMRKIAKREKKLMRPGFEGRKEGYITKDQS